MASALGMKIIYFNRHRDERVEEEYECGLSQFGSVVGRGRRGEFIGTLTPETEI